MKIEKPGVGRPLLGPAKVGCLGILGPSYCGIGAIIRIGREMLCLPYAGFLLHIIGFIRYIKSFNGLVMATQIVISDSYYHALST